MQDEAANRIRDVYPNTTITKDLAKDRPDLKAFIGEEMTVIAWLWARTVKSPSPAFGEIDVPLVSNFVVATKDGKSAYIEPIVTKRSYRFVVKMGKPSKGAEEGTKAGMRGADFRCLLSGAPITADYIRAEGRAGRVGTKLLAIVAQGKDGRVYLSPTLEAEAAARSAQPAWKPEIEFFQQALGFRVGNYGLTKWSDLFTARQLLALSTFADLVQAAIARCRADAVRAGWEDDDIPLQAGGRGARGYAEAVGTYLALAVDKVADYNSALVIWSPTRDQAKTTFARQALSMVWDFAEVNPFAGAAGDLRVSVEGIARTVVSAQRGEGCAVQADAQTQQVSKGKVVSTDPPYYDNIGYADLSDFFYVWLRRSIKPIFPDLFATIAVPKAEELVATPARHGGRKEAEAFFLNGMREAMHNVARQVHPAFPVTVFYAFKQSDTTADEGTASTGWETFLQALSDAGFSIAGTWPMRTEREVRTRGLESNALASSIILVCRPRGDEVPSIARKDFLRQLERALPPALIEMTADPSASIAPVDLQQAAIGPGMAIYSRYKTVLEADGSPMAVRVALAHINKAVDAFFAETEGDLDADTRFCIGWLQQYGFRGGPFGEADVLARAKGTAVDGLREAGVLTATKGKVRLLAIKEYSATWDPKDDSRVPVWEACHQMCRALADSEHTAGVLLARMPEKQDAIRQLAYRLYTICERQKWADEARAYDELIRSWPAIVEESVKAGLKGTQLNLV